MAARWEVWQKTTVSLYAGHKDVEIIASLVGKSVSAVQNYARKKEISLGVKRKPFTFSEDEILASQVRDGVPATAIASQMGRSVKSIRGRIEYLRGKDAIDE